MSRQPGGLYVEAHAQLLKDEAGQKWRPSNGSEGDAFIEGWCSRCTRDADQDCRILAATFVYDVEEAEYPSEWQIGADGQPKCTAWTDNGEPHHERCAYTDELPF